MLDQSWWQSGFFVLGVCHSIVSMNDFRIEYYHCVSDSRLWNAESKQLTIYYQNPLKSKINTKIEKQNNDIVFNIIIMNRSEFYKYKDSKKFII